MRQDQFDHLCAIARQKISEDVTDKTSVNSLIVEAIDLFLSCYDEAEKQKGRSDVHSKSKGGGSGADSDTQVQDNNDGAFYRYG